MALARRESRTDPRVSLKKTIMSSMTIPREMSWWKMTQRQVVRPMMKPLRRGPNPVPANALPEYRAMGVFRFSE